MDQRNRVAQHIGSFASAASCVSGTELDREDQQETPGALHWLVTFYSQLQPANPANQCLPLVLPIQFRAADTGSRGAE